VSPEQTDAMASRAPQGTPVIDDTPARAILAHADDNMVLAQRLGGWISHASDLELDIAFGNLALDHLGVARALYTLVGGLEGLNRDEDDLAMHRSEREYTNLLLVEQPNGDFAITIVRQVFFDLYQRGLWETLARSDLPDLAGIASRAAKENAYHLEFSGNWLIRLGDGTEESHHRSQMAVDTLWRFTGEMFDGPQAGLRPAWEEGVLALLTEATLSPPDDAYQKSGGRDGFHTEHLGFLLAEMQWMARSHPGLRW
jgi:ring-1,2-phenylacetyl-CoA epoxidase subunit PaaC